MYLPAFAPSASFSSPPSFAGRAVNTRRPLNGATVCMSLAIQRGADTYMFDSQKYEAKQAVTLSGVYSVQCTEGTAGDNVAEASRLAVFAKEFRLRQSSLSARFADLFATRRAAIIQSAGSHTAELYAVRFPARAAAGVAGRAEKLRACSRYIGAADKSEQYMYECVERQYKATKVVGGVYSTACADGRMSGDAETARVSALAAEFRSGQLSASQKAQMKYDASLEAIHSGRGCSYEEEQYVAYPKMAGAIRWSSGAYAASVLEAQGSSAVPGDAPTIPELVESGDNLYAVLPGYDIRNDVTKERAPWYESPIKSYAYMSEYAVKYGIEAQKDPFEPEKYQGWTPGWKTTSSVMRYVD